MVATDSKKRTRIRPAPPMAPAQIEPDDSTYSGRVAARIREVREKKGKDVDDVVAALAAQGHEISAKSLYAYENGSRKVHLDLIPAIASALGVSVHSLLPNS